MSPAVFTRGKQLNSGQTPPKSAKRRAHKESPKSRDMGVALRSVYQKTIDEAVPSDLLDLLGMLD